MFRAYQNKGFQVSFKNGLTFSVMFGKGNYCEHRGADEDSPNGSKDAEFAVFETNKPGSDKYVFADGFNGTGHVGWVSPEKIAEAMAIVAGFQFFIGQHRREKDLAELVAKLKGEWKDEPNGIGQ